MASAHVFDVTAAAFQAEVLEKSMTIPVLLDFWAAWCGPCRTLGPVLEQLAEEYGGAFRLGKVDTEREQELAYAFQVQGIPYCVLVDGGRPVDGFQGALREGDVRRFLERNGIQPLVAAAPEPTAAPTKVDPNAPAARLERALTAARAADAAAARAALNGFPEDDEHSEAARRLGEALVFLEAPLQAGGAGAEGHLAAARTALQQRAYEPAMERILAAVAADKGFRGGLPRQAMLLCFQVVGEGDERLDPFRRRLATLLY